MPTLDFHLDERSPFDREFTISEDAREPDLVVRLMDGDDPVDLTGGTVKFSMDDEGGTAKVNAQAGALFGTGDDGKVKYLWGASDTDAEALYFGQFVVTISSKDYRIPNNKTQRLRIVVGPRVN